MERALFILGIIILICSIIFGFVTGNLWGFISYIAVGIPSSVICFALSEILGNQNNIKNQLYKMQNDYNKLIAKKICLNCNESYDSDMSYCPYCGRTETKVD